ncbi:hypothetical protein VNI00_011864 [Paramarasmius palmivorus]|uniref:Uncharacterized protein n=1 Tax=Paramarasmius palmivorus TaxID=297713 RepID=A0AAW0CAR2_9AGAR
MSTALSALKFKPVEQSCASYILDLQTKFPSTTEWDENGGDLETLGRQTSRTPTLQSEDAGQDSEADAFEWKRLALRLEEELEELKAKYEAEQIKTISLTAQIEANATSEMTQRPSSPSQDATSGTDARGSNNTVKKKTTKKASAAKPAAASTSSSTLEQGTSTSNTARLPDAFFDLKVETLNDTQLTGLFSSFSQLLSALPPNSTPIPKAQKTLLLSTTVRALHSISGILRDVLFRKSNEKTPSSLYRFQKVASLLRYLLTTSLPLLRVHSKGKQKANRSLRTSEIADTILDTLTAHILNPSIHSLIPLSEIFIDEIFCNTSRGAKTASKKPQSTASSALPKDPIDLRTPVLNMVQDIISLVGTSHYISGFRESLSLTTVRELVALFDSSATSIYAELAASHYDQRETYTCSCSVHHRGTQSEDPQEGPIAVRRKMARKDTLWYLCSILHILLRGMVGEQDTKDNPSNPALRTPDVDHKSESIRLLREGVLDTLLGLIYRCRTSKSLFGNTEDTYAKPGEIRKDEIDGNAMEVVIDTTLRSRESYEGQTEKPEGNSISAVVVLDEEEHEMVLGVIERYYWILSPIVEQDESDR